MDDVNIDNNDDVEEQQLQHEEAATEQEYEQINSVLKRKETFPLRTRNKVDVLVQEFLDQLKHDIHDMLCDNGEYDDDYHGLDCNRDTEEEVEAILLLFPDVLTRRKQIHEIRDVDEYDSEDEDPPYVREFYPIQSLAVKCVGFHEDFVSNAKAVSFIPLLARLAIKLGLFEEEERGGLLCQGHENHYDYRYRTNVLENLMHSDLNLWSNNDAYKREHHKAVDDKYLQVLIQLRKMGLLKKEDIQQYHLTIKLCGEYGYFSEKRFRFLIEWDPNALINPDFKGSLPTIEQFQIVFESEFVIFQRRKELISYSIKVQVIIIGNIPSKVHVWDLDTNK